MAEVKLYKKNVSYKDKEGAEKTAVNFYIRCGTVTVPIEVKYFANKETGVDNRYRERKTVLGAFAEELPEKSDSK